MKNIARKGPAKATENDWRYGNYFVWVELKRLVLCADKKRGEWYIKC